MAMTRAEFSTLVRSYGEQGAPVNIDLTDSVLVNEVINRGLKSWSLWTYSIYDWDQVINTSLASGSIYSTDPMFQVEVVTVDGNALRNSDGVIGAESRSRFIHNNPRWRGNTSGSPDRYIQDTQDGIMFHPGPDDESRDVRVAGFVYHPAIDTSASGDNTNITVEDAWQDVAAMWVAQRMLYPAASGQSTFQRIVVMDRIASEKLKEYRAKNLGRLAGKKRLGFHVRGLTIGRGGRFSRF